MRQTIHIIILALISIISYGQHNHDFRIGTRNPQLDKLHNTFEKVIFYDEIDSLFAIRRELEDGEKIIYWDSLQHKPHFRFETKKGNVSGPFYCYNINGILTTVGNYHNDSLWTFMNGYFLLHDTTFKVGLWRYYALQDAFDSTYYSALTIDRNYKITYDIAGRFVQQWTFLNGSVWERRIFSKMLGLAEERIYNKDGTPYSDFERHPNCTFRRKWDNEGNLKSINIEDKMDYWITLRKGDEFSHWKLSDPDNKREELTNPSGENFQTRLFYPNGNLMELYDHKAGVRIKYDETGNGARVEKGKGVRIRRMNKYGD